MNQEELQKTIDCKWLLGKGYHYVLCYGRNITDPNSKLSPKAPISGAYCNTATTDIFNDSKVTSGQVVVDKCYKGYATDNFVVIDVDNKRNEETGKTGIDSFREILEKCGLSENDVKPTVKTPSGGYHYYFRMPLEFLYLTMANTWSCFGEVHSIDVRQFGGIVVCDNLCYTTLVDKLPPTKELPEMPKELWELLYSNHKDSKRLEKVIYTKDDDDMSKVCRQRYLYALAFFDLIELYGREAVDKTYGKYVVDYFVVDENFAKHKRNMESGWFKEIIPFEGVNEELRKRFGSGNAPIIPNQRPVTPVEAPVKPVESDPEEETIGDTDDDKSVLDSENEPVVEYSLDGLHPQIVERIKKKQGRLTLQASALCYICVYGSQFNNVIDVNEDYIPSALNVILVAQSGDGKGNMMKKIIGALKRKQEKADALYKEERKIYKKYKKDKRINKNKDDDDTMANCTDNQQTTSDPTEPVLPHYLIKAGATIEGTKKILTYKCETGQRHGLLARTGEGKVYFGSMNKRDKGSDDMSQWILLLDREGDRTFNSGSKYMFDDSALSVLLEIQPHTLRNVLKQRIDDLRTGFFSRWFVVIVPPIFNDRYIVKGSRRKIKNRKEIHEYEDDLLNKIHEDVIDILCVSDEALKVYQEFADTVTNIKNDNRMKCDTISRVLSSSATHGMDWCVGLAGYIHSLNQAAYRLDIENGKEVKEDKITEDIQKEEMELAVRLFWYHRRMFLEFLLQEEYAITSKSNNPQKGAMKELLRWVSTYQAQNHKTPRKRNIAMGRRIFKGKEHKQFLDDTIADCIENSYLTEDDGGYSVTMSGLNFIKN